MFQIKVQHLKFDNNLEGIILFKSLSKDEKKQIKEVFLLQIYKLEVAVQEVDEELKKLFLLLILMNF